MAESVVLERGKRAGNILLISSIINVVLNVISVIAETDPQDLAGELIASGVIYVIFFAILMILVRALKNDDIKETRHFYIMLLVISVIDLYFSLKNDSGGEALISILRTTTYILAIIALYKLGKPGKTCSLFASGISVFSLFLSVANGDFLFSDFIYSAFMIAYYILLGLYVEGKGTYVEEFVIVDQPEKTKEKPVEDHKPDYDELIKLKELMDNGVITPAEYEAKKKQILGL